MKSFPDLIDEINKIIQTELFTRNSDISLYHYTSAHGLKEMLCNNSLWFTNYRFLNDKSEKYYTFKLFRECLEEQKGNLKDDFYYGIVNECNIEYENFNSNTYQLLHDDDFIFSLSSNDDSLNLWNYYTKSSNKTGYNIKFNPEALINDWSSVLLGKVVYDKSKQKELINRLINIINEQIDKPNILFFINHLLQLINNISILFKHPSFREEEEYRFVITASKEKRKYLRDKELLNFRESNGLIIPYLNVPISKNSIEGIKISPLQKDPMAKEGILAIIRALGYDHIKDEDITYSKLPLRF